MERMRSVLLAVGMLLVSGCVGSVIVEEQLGGDDVTDEGGGLNGIETDAPAPHPTLLGGAPPAPTTTTPWFVDAGAP